MARAILQRRSLTGFAGLTTTTQDLTVTPPDLPDGSTVTRVLGSLTLEYVPTASSAPRALFCVGLAVIDDAETPDVALPNSHPDVWLGWWYQPLLLNFQTSPASGPIARDFAIPFDVHGQRILTPSAGIHLRFFARLVSPITAGTAGVRIGLVQFFKLPET